MQLIYQSSLSHSGIKGMKWGKRRYQYKDGSLTPEGKKRYLKEAVSSEKLLNASIGPRLKEAGTSSEKLLNASIGPRLKEAGTSSEKLLNASIGPRLKEVMASSEKLLSMKIESIPDKNKTLGEKFVSSYINVKEGLLCN